MLFGPGVSRAKLCRRETFLGSFVVFPEEAPLGFLHGSGSPAKQGELGTLIKTGSKQLSRLQKFPVAVGEGELPVAART